MFEQLISEGFELLDKKSQNVEFVPLAKDKFEKALDLKPESVTVNAALSEIYSLLVAYGIFEQQSGLRLAKEFSEKALELNPNDLYSQKIGFRVALYIDLNLQKAEKILTKLLNENPDEIELLHLALDMATYRANKTEVTRIMEQINSVQPTYLGNERLIWYNYYSENFEEAAKCVEKTLEQDENHRNALRYGSRVYAQLGNFNKSFLFLEKIKAENIDINLSLYGEYATTLAIKGERDLANKCIEQIKRIPSFPDKIQSFRLAQIYAALNEKEQSLNYLEESFTRREPFILWIKMDPIFKNLKTEPRFLNITEKIQLGDKKW